MLASLLPGLRDLRVPLATGFLWLVVLWLLTYPVIPTQDEASGLAAEVYEALEVFGPAALIAGITFVAYIVGILLARPGNLTIQALLRLAGKSGPRLSSSSRIESLQLASRTAAEMVRVGAELPGELTEEQIYFEGSDDRRIGSRSAQEAHESFMSIARALSERMDGEIALVATRLLADSRDLFDRYDRAEAEAAFRFSIALPLVAISALVPWRLELEWWGYGLCAGIGVSVAAALLIEGARKQMESNDAIFQAVFSKKADFPSIETARAAIAQSRELGQQRDKEKSARAAKRREEAETERRVIERAETEAAAVEIALRGGGGQGSGDELEMTSVRVDLINDSDRAVVIDGFKLDPPLIAKGYPPFPIRLAGNEAKSLIVEIEHIDISDGELSGETLPRFAASVTYRLDGRRWIRNSGDNSRPRVVT
jgi:hypothetical protein